MNVRAVFLLWRAQCHQCFSSFEHPARAFLCRSSLKGRAGLTLGGFETAVMHRSWPPFISHALQVHPPPQCGVFTKAEIADFPLRPHNAQAPAVMACYARPSRRIEIAVSRLAKHRASEPENDSGLLDAGGHERDLLLGLQGLSWRRRISGPQANSCRFLVGMERAAVMVSGARAFFTKRD